MVTLPLREAWNGPFVEKKLTKCTQIIIWDMLSRSSDHDGEAQGVQGSGDPAVAGCPFGLSVTFAPSSGISSLTLCGSQASGLLPS